jgi:uncharacterized membrane protein (UPF0127 family)
MAGCIIVLMKNKFVVLLSFLFISVFLFLFFSFGDEKKTDEEKFDKEIAVKTKEVKSDEKNIDIILNGTLVSCEIADTNEKRTKGLSGRTELEDGNGMLFVYPVSKKYAFWMRDMNFPIDIIWINKDFQVVYIKENATPESYPKLFKPEKPAQYVLEVPAFFARDNDVKVGDVASFP